MNIKDMLMVMGFSLISMWAVDYFILGRYKTEGGDQAKSGQTFSAPQNKQVVRPINREIDFIDAKRATKELITKVNMPWATLTFSSDGAALERLEFKHKNNSGDESIITIFPSVSREEKAFLVALDEKTPYYFTLVDKTENDISTELTYEGSFGDGILRKRFTILKELHKIDLHIQIKPNAGIDRAVQARIFYPAPIMPMVKSESIQAVVADAQDSVTKTPVQQINLQEGWWSPTLFGAENRYFVHALVADDNDFVERAYYTVSPEERLFAILEGYPVDPEQGEQSKTVSFYVGPKDAQAMGPVDIRLEQTLDYSGILSPLSKLLLKLLNFLYSYVHNYGFAILLLTFLIKLFLFPFTMRGERTMRKGPDMQKKMQYIQKKYKDDPERLRLEQAELIKKYGMPQLTGCLPLLAQIPIFIALSRVLSNSIQLYKSPFIGWIHDLSAPDPYYVLPALIASSMILQALSGDAKMRMPMIAMALFFGAVSSNFASGLVLYICASTLLGVAQTKLQKRTA